MSSESPAARSEVAKVLVCGQLLLEIQGLLPIGQRSESDRDRSFLDGLADCGDNRAVLKPELSRELPVGIVDPSARKDERTRRESHAFGAFDHQQLGRAAGPLSNDDQGCGGDCLVGHSAHLSAAAAKKKPPERCPGGSFMRVTATVTCR